MVRTRLRTAVIGSVVVVTVGCSLFDTRGVALLERPPSVESRGSISRPEKPFSASAPGGPYARSTFSATEANYVIEIRDVLVAPTQKIVELDAPGAGVFEVREGAGTVTLGGNTTAVAMGATFFVSEGEKIRIESRGGPMILRAHLFRSR